MGMGVGAGGEEDRLSEIDLFRSGKGTLQLRTGTGGDDAVSLHRQGAVFNRSGADGQEVAGEEELQGDPGSRLRAQTAWAAGPGFPEASGAQRVSICRSRARI